MSERDLKKRVGPAGGPRDQNVGSVAATLAPPSMGTQEKEKNESVQSAPVQERKTGCAVYKETAQKGEGEPKTTDRGPGGNLRVARVLKSGTWKSLVILRGYIRTPTKEGDPGPLKRVEMRAMLDTGSTACFISRELATRIGVPIEKGEFGHAIQAFGAKDALTEMVRGVDLEFGGVQPGSLLATQFNAKWEMIVAPRRLSDEYDILLGTRFLHQFYANVRMGLPSSIQLTALDGSITQIEDSREVDEGKETAQPRVGFIEVCSRPKPSPPHRPRSLRPPTGTEMRVMIRDQRVGEEERILLAERAARECPELVISGEESREWLKDQNATCAMVYIRPQSTIPADEKSDVHVNATRTGSPVTRAEEISEEERRARLPEAERAEADRRLAGVLKDYADVFPTDLPAGLPPMRGNDGVRIEMKDNAATPGGRYGPRMTPEDTDAAGVMIDELLTKGFIRPSRSPWGSPMFLVAKPDGGKRMVIDYRALNSATVRNRYPLPRVDELFDRLQGARYFSKIDLRTGYWQIRMAEESVAKTAFTSRHGHFEWMVLPMGLTNAPAEFMALMEDTFRDMLNKSVLAFLDDILVYSKTLEEHEQHLRAVMEKLRAAKLYGKLSKCSFFRQEVEFLGHYVGRDGIRMVDEKVAAVERWPEPTKQKDVEQFIGLAGYYRRFIENFSKIASPLTEMCGTLKKVKGGGATRATPIKPFAWGEEQRQAFRALKEAVISAPCLAMPDSSREFVVHTDASGYATGAVLMQQFPEGMRPIAFLSRKMTRAERNYPVHEQELLAILNALKAWRHYLGGRRFTVLTDHQSLQYVESSAMATPRQMRWASWLSEFDFAVKYVPGKTNVIADGLSRGAAGGSPEEEPEEASPTQGVDLLINAISDMAPLPVRIREAAAADAEYTQLLAKSKEELAAMKPSVSADNGLLYRANGDYSQLVIPDDASLRTWILSWAHDARESAHRGGERMRAWLSSRVWWSKMEEDTAKYSRGCETCQRNKPDLRGSQGLPMSIATPGKEFDVLCMDFIGPLPVTPRGHDAIMVVVDKLTRYTFYVPMKITTTAQEVYHALNARVLAITGTPREIISDRDSRFTSRFWEDIWAGAGTELKRSTAFHPQTDGQTERANRVLIEALRSYVDAQQTDWDILLPDLQRATNSSKSASTGLAPDVMLFGSPRRSGLDAALDADGALARLAYPGAEALKKKREAAEKKAREVIEKAQAKQRRDAAPGRRAGEIKVHDLVWLANKNLRVDAQGLARKLGPLYHGPYEVTAMHGSNAAQIALPAECKLHPVFNLDLLRKYIDGREEFPDRPEMHARLGPIPEEDPDAGGPGAPVHEVEAILATRVFRGKRQYRVKWLGWPIEQSSWQSAEDCSGCLEKVEEFLRSPAARRSPRENASSQRMEAEIASQLAAIEIRVAAARVRGSPPIPQTESERNAREAARAAVTLNVPVDEKNLPPINKNGERVMPSQRCIAPTRRGPECKQRTRHGALCFTHRGVLDGLKIKKSGIKDPKAGKGLFATRDFKKDEVIARYTGDLIPTPDGKEEANGSHYVLELTEKVSIDAARTNAADGRMANNAPPGKTNNAKFSVNQRAPKSATMRAKRKIKKGEEIFVSYGRNFFPTGSRNRPIVLRAVEVQASAVTVERRESDYYHAGFVAEVGMLEEQASTQEDSAGRQMDEEIAALRRRVYVWVGITAYLHLMMSKEWEGTVAALQRQLCRPNLRDILAEFDRTWEPRISKLNRKIDEVEWIAKKSRGGAAQRPAPGEVWSSAASSSSSRCQEYYRADFTAKVNMLNEEEEIWGVADEVGAQSPEWREMEEEYRAMMDKRIQATTVGNQFRTMLLEDWTALVESLGEYLETPGLRDTITGLAGFYEGRLRTLRAQTIELEDRLKVPALRAGVPTATAEAEASVAASSVSPREEEYYHAGFVARVNMLGEDEPAGDKPPQEPRFSHHVFGDIDSAEEREQQQLTGQIEDAYSPTSLRHKLEADAYEAELRQKWMVEEKEQEQWKAAQLAKLTAEREAKRKRRAREKRRAQEEATIHGEGTAGTASTIAASGVGPGGPGRRSGFTSLYDMARQDLESEAQQHSAAAASTAQQQHSASSSSSLRGAGYYNQGGVRHQSFAPQGQQQQQQQQASTNAMDAVGGMSGYTQGMAQHAAAAASSHPGGGQFWSAAGQQEQELARLREENKQLTSRVLQLTQEIGVERTRVAELQGEVNVLRVQQASAAAAHQFGSSQTFTRTSSSVGSPGTPVLAATQGTAVAEGHGAVSLGGQAQGLGATTGYMQSAVHQAAATPAMPPGDRQLIRMRGARAIDYVPWPAPEGRTPWIQWWEREYGEAVRHAHLTLNQRARAEKQLRAAARLARDVGSITGGNLDLTHVLFNRDRAEGDPIPERPELCDCNYVDERMGATKLPHQVRKVRLVTRVAESCRQSACDCCYAVNGAGFCACSAIPECGGFCLGCWDKFQNRVPEYKRDQRTYQLHREMVRNWQNS